MIAAQSMEYLFTTYDSNHQQLVLPGPRDASLSRFFPACLTFHSQITKKTRNVQITVGLIPCKSRIEMQPFCGLIIEFRLIDLHSISKLSPLCWFSLICCSTDESLQRNPVLFHTNEQIKILINAGAFSLTFGRVTPWKHTVGQLSSAVHLLSWRTYKSKTEGL